MSRVAKAPIVLPANVELTVDKDTVTVKGPKGSLTQHRNRLVDVQTTEENGKKVIFKPASNDPNAWAQAGTARALVNNMVKGVTDGFEMTLELVGVGYRAQAKGKSVSLSLGYSHNIDYNLPEGVVVETPNNTTVILKGINNQLLGQVAAEIRAFRPPEPYKGKGVKYAGEVIIRKEAKKK
ncbi:MULTISPECIES: 50S ribosomal protein L6 [Legionella]|uniref:Large ribosomal subunit protein uL6 n=1 Tax=Legionella septentrionalis TaxID=2498109 RepID=A0A3S0X311_9GAMM|nr:MULTISPECIES: 50S ribosomal protein L6 [Legionella]MCP0913825.1 50S ribosomal protein L6 [Legionella sp. 27cVA30]RUQ81036.1 50S ribosomal protein L6 [Legionella septentrionalis]RUQ98672.1 50S ribosomal protein L6 [Legionella septentrionalis]RUR09956.1 50S ribosomal protein L6 [Legionella septentrionalis]RUR14965.1 50S ribosomal protein L6 [Legionella septentrionalis]